MKTAKAQMELMKDRQICETDVRVPGEARLWEREEAALVPGLVVSIHDVCPGTLARTEQMLADIAAVGVNSTSLLVIPNRHGSDPSFGDADVCRRFCGWLREAEDAGHELVLHGYWHRRVAPAPARGWHRLVANHYTAGEGEFYDADFATACELLERGREEMRTALGHAPAGFIAPAWLLGPGACSALRQSDFSYTTLLQGLWDLEQDVFYRSQSLCYSVRANWRRVVSNLWNSTLLAWIEECPFVRISLHPPDWDFAAIRGHALRCIERALAGRAAMTYCCWLNLQRKLSPHSFS